MRVRMDAEHVLSSCKTAGLSGRVVCATAVLAAGIFADFCRAQMAVSDVAITNKASASVVILNRLVTNSIIVTNMGPDPAMGVVVSNTFLSPGALILTLTQSQGNFTSSSNSFVWT